MEIKKAVITAASPDQRSLPLQTLVGSDGVSKPALRILLDEVVGAGIEQCCLVIVPGDEAVYTQAAGVHAGRLTFVEQHAPRGYGHAISLARPFTGAEPFLHLVSDHLYVSRGTASCAGQLLSCARTEGCSVSAVQPTREHMLPYYGTVGGRRVPRHADLYEIDCVLEKPTPTEAEQHVHVPGLRAGHYLCFFGLHVLTPMVHEILAHLLAGSEERKIQLSQALAELARRERYYALEVHGVRYDIGGKYGLFQAQLGLALEGKDREEVLSHLLEQLAQRAQPDRFRGAPVAGRGGE